MNRKEAVDAIAPLQTKLSLAMNDIHHALSRIRTLPEEKDFYTRYIQNATRLENLFDELADCLAVLSSDMDVLK